MMKPVIDVVRESMHVWTQTKINVPIVMGDHQQQRAEFDEMAHHIIAALDAAGYRIVPK
jgi:hypothetical protein